MDQTPFNPPSDLRPYLQLMVRMRASDLFLTVQAPPTLKVEGTMRRLDTKPLDSNEVRALAYSVLRESQRKAFETELECDLAIAVEGLGRFRVNVYWQRGDVAMVARHISSSIPTLETLRLPPILKDLAMLKRGLVLVVGAAGSGKSTTLASMLDFRNANSACHILTVEDPIEFTHVHKMSLVDQREVGLDTRSFGDALRHAMREAPDVIMIGEIRDRETIQHALSYAETGHLCVSTLHSNNANQAIDRILNLFPDEARKQALLDTVRCSWTCRSTSRAWSASAWCAAATASACRRWR